MLHSSVSLLSVIPAWGRILCSNNPLLQGIIPKTLGLFFTREISKVPIPSAPCESSFDLPHVFLRLADSRQTTTQKWGEHSQDVFLTEALKGHHLQSPLTFTSAEQHTGNICLCDSGTCRTHRVPGARKSRQLPAHLLCTRWF